MKRTGWLLLLGLAAGSCTRKNADFEKSTVDTLTARSEAAPQKQVDRFAVGVIQRTTLMEPEYKDTVCWENCPPYYLMGAQDVVEAMSLRSLTQGELPAKMFLKHRLDVSTAFHTVVVACQPSENEIRNYLVTYSRQGERIDTCLVAADEIAEGLLSAYSIINANNPCGILKKSYYHPKQTTPNTKPQPLRQPLIEPTNH